LEYEKILGKSGESENQNPKMDTGKILGKLPMSSWFPAPAVGFFDGRCR
jgi:hypothetical protein